MFFNKKKISHYEKLSKKWIDKHLKIQQELWEKHRPALEHIQKNAKQLAVSSLAGLLLFATPATNIPLPQLKTFKEKSLLPDLNNQQSFLVDLTDTIPSEVRELTPQEEARIAQVLTQHTGIAVSAEVQGIRLNRSHGYIGKEQHLARFPGDAIDDHID